MRAVDVLSPPYQGAPRIEANGHLTDKSDKFSPRIFYGILIFSEVPPQLDQAAQRVGESCCGWKPRLTLQRSVALQWHTQHTSGCPFSEADVL